MIRAIGVNAGAFSLLAEVLLNDKQWHFSLSF